MLDHFMFNEMRDMSKIITEIRKNTTKQLYNQMKLAEENNNENMENIFYDLFENEEKVDNRSNFDLEDGYATITQNSEKLFENEVVLNEVNSENLKFHLDKKTLCVYYEEDEKIHIQFYIDDEEKGSYEFEGISPFVSSRNGIFHIVYLIEDEGYGVYQPFQQPLDPHGSDTEDDGEFISTQTTHDKRDPVFIPGGTNHYFFKSNYDEMNRLEYDDGSVTKLVDHSSEVKQMGAIKLKNRYLYFFTDLENGKEQLCFIDEKEKEVHRITEDTKEEKGFSLFEKDDVVYVISLCEEYNYMNVKQTQITIEEEDKDSIEFGIERKTITESDVDLDKTLGTIDKDDRLTYYYLKDNTLTVLYDNESYDIEDVDDFFVGVYQYQLLFSLKDGHLNKYNFDELYIEDEDLYVHTPEKNSKIYSVDISDEDGFNVIHLYLYRDESDLEITPRVNFKKKGEEFYDFKLISTKEKGVGEIEEHYSINIDESKKFNLLFELEVENRTDTGKFFGYGVTFI